MKKLLIILITLILSSGNVWANGTRLPCRTTDGQDGYSWCHFPGTNASKWNLLCLPEPAITDQGHTNHNWDHFASSLEIAEGCKPPINVITFDFAGYKDGLYICGVEIVDHLCTDEKNTPSEADHITIDGKYMGHKWKMPNDEKPELGTAGSDYRKTINIHLNSFEFGSVIEVKYCYDFMKEETTSEVEHMGYMSGDISSTLGDSDYFDMAGLSAWYGYKCWMNRKIMYVGDSADNFPGPLTRGSEIRFLLPDMEMDMGDMKVGGCIFKAKFTEENFGTIRSLKPGTGLGQNRLYSGFIYTDVDLEMLLKVKESQ